MTKSVYIIGSAGAGKSTFTAELMERVVAAVQDLTDLHALANPKNIVTLRGHPVVSWNGGHGLYLGLMRDRFPGTDGLDRASSPVGEAWLQQGDLPEFIISEGATLATRRFLHALYEYTDLLLVHLTVDDATRTERFARRGSNQDAKFVLNTQTRSSNLFTFLLVRGANCVSVDTADPDAWQLGLDFAEDHLTSG